MQKSKKIIRKTWGYVTILWIIWFKNRGIGHLVSSWSLRSIPTEHLPNWFLYHAEPRRSRRLHIASFVLVLSPTKTQSSQRFFSSLVSESPQALVLRTSQRRSQRSLRVVLKDENGTLFWDGMPSGWLCGLHCEARSARACGLSLPRLETRCSLWLCGRQIK